MTTLTLTDNTLDTLHTFNVEAGRRVMKASLRCGYDKKDDGIYWALSTGAALKSEYSQADIDERARLAEEDPLSHCDTVTIDGALYTVRVLGPYSNCAIFDKV